MCGQNLCRGWVVVSWVVKSGERSKDSGSDGALCKCRNKMLWLHISPTVLVEQPIIISTMNQKDHWWGPRPCSIYSLGSTAVVVFNEYI